MIKFGALMEPFWDLIISIVHLCVYPAYTLQAVCYFYETITTSLVASLYIMVKGHYVCK